MVYVSDDLQSLCESCVGLLHVENSGVVLGIVQGPAFGIPKYPVPQHKASPCHTEWQKTALRSGILPSRNQSKYWLLSRF